MYAVPPDEHADFPRAGARARRWLRFETALHEWLDTPDGRFASWCAQREVDAAQAAQLAHSPVTTTSE
jgi:hypothetical protein